MDIEYLHGQRVTPLLHEMSPLEAAIQRYAEKAKEYYRTEKNFDRSITEEQRQKRLNEALKHLEREQAHAENFAKSFGKLEAYREQGNAYSKSRDGRDVLLVEKHHPTRLLAKYMRAAGKPQPSSKHSAHHVVPGKGKTERAALARIQIHRLGIRINDPDNGCWLVRKMADTPHWSMPHARSHLSYHTHNYERWVYDKLSSERTENAARSRLNIMGRMLQDGNYPGHISPPAT